MAKQFDCSNDDFGFVLNCAVRYAIGRKTYAPHIVINWIFPIIQKLSTRTLKCFVRDIREYEKINCLGDQVDAEAWKHFCEAAEDEIQKRGCVL